MKNNNIAVFEKRNNKCPLCKQKNIEFLYNISKFDPQFSIDRCKNCDFIFMNPQFSKSTIKSFYTEDYYKGNSEYSYYDERESERHSRFVWDKRINIIRKYQKSGNFLDIGSSFGGFLNAAQPFFNVHGIEISDYAAKESQKKFGDKIHHGTVENHNFKNDFFNVITMIEVIEHLVNPKEIIKNCFNLLKKDGILVLQTANMDGIQAKSEGSNYHYFMPGHISYFSKKNLSNLLKEIGFSKIVIYRPVEFGLLPKLKKSKQKFKRKRDYFNWFKITYYHYKSMIHFGNFSLTSSMVIYAVK